MASIIARRAVLSIRSFSSTSRRLAEGPDAGLKGESKRNPELIVRHIQHPIATQQRS
jgi:hypothetical protein